MSDASELLGEPLVPGEDAAEIERAVCAVLRRSFCWESDVNRCLLVHRCLNNFKTEDIYYGDVPDCTD